jgi:hypothetical protein
VYINPLLRFLHPSSTRTPTSLSPKSKHEVSYGVFLLSSPKCNYFKHMVLGLPEIHESSGDAVVTPFFSKPTTPGRMKTLRL